MEDGTKAIFSVLDDAKTQRCHYKVMVIAGMGFFTDAYDIFCITAVTKLIGRLYYYDHTVAAPGKLPSNINNAITGAALCGTLVGQLFFGWLGDKLGRRKVYGMILIIMVVFSLASGVAFGSAKSVVAFLCCSRFFLGVGIGGDYPLSAVIMSEYANQRTRGAFIAAVFAMQGIGILFAGGVSTIVSKIFMDAYKAPIFSENPILSTQPQANLAWRIVLMLGAVPAALTYYLRMKMPETARYTVLVEGNPRKAVEDMARVLEHDEAADMAKLLNGNIQTASSIISYKFFSAKFFRRHGIHLLGTTITWFLLDIVFYTLQLTQNDISLATGLLKKSSTMNALQEMNHISKAMTIIALFATIPGYLFTIFLVDRIGRYVIQIGGFLLMTIFMAILGIQYGNLRGEESNCGSDSEKDFCNGKPILFVLLFGLTLFFANFGPNTTTFIVPAELFPARFRCTCHGISAAGGKLGAIIAAFVVQSYTIDGNSEKIKKAIIGLAVVNLIGFFFSFFVPETKGKSLEEISREDNDLAISRRAHSFT
ncbi:low affinity inorganic phosphate transporter 8-like [Mercurialis annua]|uniref:low affinity inorganic phosphate transporter 8-like n=1 Tax=Mercurialis annua TaxID=3986 RepID=UPI002160440D|nr:low affinity inorganic phosphate transporter 8-like [Mercurialis annua]